MTCFVQDFFSVEWLLFPVYFCMAGNSCCADCGGWLTFKHCYFKIMNFLLCSFIFENNTYIALKKYWKNKSNISHIWNLYYSLRFHYRKKKEPLAFSFFFLPFLLQKIVSDGISQKVIVVGKKGETNIKFNLGLLDYNSWSFLSQMTSCWYWG